MESTLQVKIVMLLCLFSAVLCVSCERQQRAVSITLLTNIKEAPLYATMFNASQAAAKSNGEESSGSSFAGKTLLKRFQKHFQFDENIVQVSLAYYDESATGGKDAPSKFKNADVVMAAHLQKKDFQDISPYFAGDINSFNPALFAFSEPKEDADKRFHTSLLPVNYNFDAAIFDEANAPFFSGNGAAKDNADGNGIITLKELQEAAERYCAGHEKSRVGQAVNSGNGEKTIISAAKNNDEFTDNFVRKYLSMPPEKQVLSGRCLFAIVPTSTLDALSANVSYKYIADSGGKCILRDDMVMIGVPKKRWQFGERKRKKAIRSFITWFMSADTHSLILYRKQLMALETNMMGIAGGFSSLLGDMEDGTYGARF